MKTTCLSLKELLMQKAVLENKLETGKANELTKWLLERINDEIKTSKEHNFT